MTARTQNRRYRQKSRANKSTRSKAHERRREIVIRYFPIWFILGVIAVMTAPVILSAIFQTVWTGLRGVPGFLADAGTTALNLGADAVEIAVDVGEDVVVFVVDTAEGAVDRVGDLFDDGSQSAPEVLAPLFTPEVTHWEADIARWSTEYDLDPNLLATVMQIESCGHPTVSSHAGAQGLFQVMPFHFGSDENQLDPDTNAMRGAGVLNDCLRRSNGDAGLAMACYNGGPSVLYKDMSTWLDEPRRYYYWGVGIYADALQNSSSSPRLDEWLAAGGSRLCDMASGELRLER